jgi:predicted phage baseplate assembly protein
MSHEARWGDLIVPGDARRRKIRELHGNGLDGVEVHKEGTRLIVYFLDRAPTGLLPGNVRIDEPAGSVAVRAVGVRRSTDADRELQDRVVVDLDRAGSPGRYRLALVEREPGGRPGRATYRGIDPRFADAWFQFDVDAPLPPIARTPPGSPASGYDVSYLGRDYEGLRQVMLDRLGVTIPAWSERHAADILVTLVELLAFAGDDLSYYADAVATEAYLQTARRRVSVRRHARLVDYRLNEGCTARAWVCVEVSGPLRLPLRAIRFAVAGAVVDGRQPVIDARSIDARRLARLQQYTALPADDPSIDLHPTHNEIGLWSWGEADSHLVRGATHAVLRDGEPVKEGSANLPEPERALHLRPGDVLVFEETRDPESGSTALADTRRRQAVRLTAVRRLFDELYDQPLLEVSWAVEDALRFDLAVTAAGQECSHAAGNVVLVTHGVAAHEKVAGPSPRLSQPQLSFSTPFPDPEVVARHQARRLRALYRNWRAGLERWFAEALRGTPLSRERRDALRQQLGERELDEAGLIHAGDYDDPAERAAQDACGLAELLAQADRLLAGRRRRAEVLARLAEASGPLDEVLVAELEADWGASLTHALAPSHPGAWGPAAQALTQDPNDALPVLELAGEHRRDGGRPRRWAAALDLIGITETARAVVAEIDDEGIANLQISAPPQKDQFLNACYRVGNGTRGNAPALAVNAIVWLDNAFGGESAIGELSAAITAVGNPLPATGGVDPEDTAAAKRAIPGSFLDHQPRALTASDYAVLARSERGVRRAAAELRFSGSLTAVDIALQPALGEDPPPDLMAGVQQALESVRRIGHVVRVGPPRYRPLVIALDVTLTSNAVRAHIADAFAELMSSGWRTDGTPAVFNPERLDFGTPVYSSAVIAAAHTIDGVRSATLTRFGFVGEPEPACQPTAPEALPIGPLELPRLDNDPVRPQHGFALVALEGGR